LAANTGGQALSVNHPAHFLAGSATTYTDILSSGTVALAPSSYFTPGTFAARLATTYTTAATVYISGAPAAGANVTLTNPYALYVAAGASYFGGNGYFGGNLGIGVNPATYLLDVQNSSTAVDYIAGRFLSSAAVSGESHTWVKIEKSSNYGGAVGGYISQGVGSGLLFGTQNNAATPTERMRIDNNGNVGIGTSSPVGQLNVYGAGQTTSAFSTSSNLGGTIYVRDTGAAPGNGGAVMFGANQGAFAAIKGLLADGTNNTVGALAFSNRSANTDSTLTERMRIDSSGNVSIGQSGTTTGTNLLINANISGATTAYGQLNSGIIQSGVTVRASAYVSNIQTAAAAFTTTDVSHFWAFPGTGGAGSTITNQYGFLADSGLGIQGAATVTNAYGFYGGIASAANRWNLYMGGTANNYMAGNLGIGSTSLTSTNLVIGANITGATTAIAQLNNGVIQSGVTNIASAFFSNIAAAAASFTITEVDHFIANPNTGGAGSTITTQIGFNAAATLATAGAATVTAAYGFSGNIAAGTNRWNLYMAGTANNYMAGNLGIGSTNLTAYNLNVGANITGATISGAVLASGIVQSGVTTASLGFYSNISQVASSTNSAAYHFYAAPAVGGSGSTIGSQFGFYAESTIGTGGAATITNAYGFYGNIASGANRWNLYMNGTANNLFKGYSFGLGGVMATTNATATNTATLTATQIASGFIVGTPTATASYTLPLASALDTELSNAATGYNFEIVVFTTAAFAITLLTNTGWTLVGSMATGATANSFARFRAVKTGTAAYSLYRIS
jgi:hypothetical protein